jgi:hypothetical protein
MIFVAMETPDINKVSECGWTISLHRVIVGVPHHPVFGAKTASQYHDRMPSLAAAFRPRKLVITVRYIFVVVEEELG